MSFPNPTLRPLMHTVHRGQTRAWPDATIVRIASSLCRLERLPPLYYIACTPSPDTVQRAAEKNFEVFGNEHRSRTVCVDVASENEQQASRSTRPDSLTHAVRAVSSDVMYCGLMVQIETF
jgi:hypothetical protein